MSFMLYGDWIDCLSYNLRIAGGLWAAWSGGASTIINDRFATYAHGLEFVGDLEDFSAFTVYLDQQQREEAEPKRARLTLVP